MSPGQASIDNYVVLCEKQRINCWVLVGILMLVSNAAAVADDVDFQRDVLPILSDRCFACHGPDSGSREAELRLDNFTGATAELGGGGYAIVPGHPTQSVMLERIRSSDEDMRMPPRYSNLQVTNEEATLLEQWIQQGAHFDQHWAFVPLPNDVAVPPVSDHDWPIQPCDSFVLARLEASGLKPSQEADKRTWLRRITFDLIGLPPTPEEIDVFLDDTSPSAYDAVVDRLLGSPHFGERMAVPWLDAARYADSYGYQSDQLSTTWPWRDWVIRALNENLPFDDFLTWQIAGDLLSGATTDQRLATSFNRLHRMTGEGGSISEEFRTEYVADRVSTLGTAVLGLTIECARCHDHKFDPLTQREFYELSAFFDNIDEWGTYNDSARVPTPSMLLPTPAQQDRWSKLKQHLADAERAYAVAIETGESRFEEWLQQSDLQVEIPGLVGYYPLDEIASNHSLANFANSNLAGSTSAANRLVPGRIGRALELAGDEAVNFPKVCGGLHPHETFSVALWLRLPKDSADGLVFHRSGGSDVGYHGTEVRVKDGRLFFGMTRFWPGNAIAVESADPLPTGEWVHVVVTYDASAAATGMHLYVDGIRADRVVRDNLYKSPGHSGSGLTFGQRYRDQTIRGMMFDEMRTYDRALSGVEAAQLYDSQSLAKAIEQRNAAQLRAYYFVNFDSVVGAARTRRSRAAAELLGFQSALPEVMVMEELPSPRESYLLARGAYDAPKSDDTRVTPAVPTVLGALPDPARSDRQALARWLTSPQHPLTARVAVNRIWQVFFGRGLVESSENFGTQGTPPSHPQLLDWLARDFVDNGWDTKRLCRQLALSATYRQSSKPARAVRDRDPQNRLLTRGPSERLGSEMIRDAALAASGLLNRQIGGPPVSPYQPSGLWREANSMSPAYRQSVGKALYRRSLYTVVKRTAPAPNMIAFDAPSREFCSVRRSTTNTPIQALVLLNDTQFVEASRVLGERMVSEGGDTVAEQISFAFIRLAGRLPTPEEEFLLVELYTEQLAIFAEDASAAQKLLEVGDAPVDAEQPAQMVAAATVVAQAILNLDATIWKR